MTNGPTRFEVHESGALLHGTKAHLAVGDLLAPVHLSNYESGRVMNHVSVTETLDPRPGCRAGSRRQPRPYLLWWS